jgi:CheY-like chemotaxis protein
MSKRILSVDDNKIIGWTLAVTLWAAEYEVRHVSSALEAFSALAEEKFDMVLLDLEMPNIGGLEALSIINLRRLCPDTAVVLLTSSDELSDIQQARALGARGYLTKAYASKALIKSVDRIMDDPLVSWLDDFHCVTRPGRRAEANLDTVEAHVAFAVPMFRPYVPSAEVSQAYAGR